MKKVVVIGGGFSGAVTAMHLVRDPATPIDVTVVEPRAEVGPGLPYSATDPDHRLNAPATIHYIAPDQDQRFGDWLEQTGRLENDPDMEIADGSRFARRGDFGAYVAAEFKARSANLANGSSLRHKRDAAVGLEHRDGRFHVALRSGGHLTGDLIVLAISNEQPAIPAAFATLADTSNRFLADPWDVEKFVTIGRDANVLILGAGLTAADVIVTLLRDKPEISITAISRTGIRPASRSDSPAARLPEPLATRVNRRPSLFDARHGELTSVRSILKALRRDVAAHEQADLPWQIPFDELRDSVRPAWTRLSLEEKRRFIRHLRRYYDSRRFRYPPQTEAAVLAGERAGKVRFEAVHIDRVTELPDATDIDVRDRSNGRRHTWTCDWVINCSGPSARVEHSSNPFLRSVVRGGLVRPASLGIGLDVNLDCQAISASGDIQCRLFVVGPMTFATFGYTLGTPFIVDQIVHALPVMRSALAAPVDTD